MQSAKRKRYAERHENRHVGLLGMQQFTAPRERSHQSWLHLSEQLRAIDKWNLAGFLVSLVFSGEVS